MGGPEDEGLSRTDPLPVAADASIFWDEESSMRGEDPAEAIRRWLRSGATISAKLLAAKAVVLLSPGERVGEIVWPSYSDVPAA